MTQTTICHCLELKLLNPKCPGPDVLKLKAPATLVYKNDIEIKIKINTFYEKEFYSQNNELKQNKFFRKFSTQERTLIQNLYLTY